MKYVTIVFDYKERQGMYVRLYDVFEKSLKHYNPKAEIETYHVDAPKIKHNPNRSFVSNTHKLNVYCEVVKKAKEDLILIDCDMLAKGDISDAFNKSFDIGYTTREKKLPFNGGVMFVRPTENTQKFFKKYLEINKKMLMEPAWHYSWRLKYAGINQSAFGYMLEKYEDTVALEKFPARIYNACDESWTTAIKEAKMIHIKGRLRKLCLGTMNANSLHPGVLKIVNEWQRWSHA